jgi:hypothetical protein
MKQKMSINFFKNRFRVQILEKSVDLARKIGSNARYDETKTIKIIHLSYSHGENDTGIYRSPFLETP